MHSSVVFLLRNSKKMTTGSWSKFFTLHANIRAYLFWPPVKQIFRTHKPSHHITYSICMSMLLLFFSVIHLPAHCLPFMTVFHCLLFNRSSKYFVPFKLLLSDRFFRLFFHTLFHRVISLVHVIFSIYFKHSKCC